MMNFENFFKDFNKLLELQTKKKFLERLRRMFRRKTSQFFFTQDLIPRHRKLFFTGIYTKQQKESFRSISSLQNT